VAEFDEVEETPASRRDLTLPEPLDEFRTCRRCYQVDACMLYRKAVEPHPFPSSAQESGLLDLYENKTSHLSSDHLHFFRKWDRLVSLEEKELVRYRKEMWTISAAERQELGRYATALMKATRSLTLGSGVSLTCVSIGPLPPRTRTTSARSIASPTDSFDFRLLLRPAYRRPL
jgi:hypothetical protein